jgi:hypothetical protein
MPPQASPLRSARVPSAVSELTRDVRQGSSRPVPCGYGLAYRDDTDAPTTRQCPDAAKLDSVSERDRQDLSRCGNWGCQSKRSVVTRHVRWRQSSTGRPFPWAKPADGSCRAVPSRGNTGCARRAGLIPPRAAGEGGRGVLAETSREPIRTTNTITPTRPARRMRRRGSSHSQRACPCSPARVRRHAA